MLGIKHFISYRVIEVPEAPAAAVTYLESLTKYLRGIHTSANVDTTAESPKNEISSESRQITHLNISTFLAFC